ncbi:MAG: sensor histidine kinase [Hymenobacter sp.]|nr:MAG: sensor histidine kinase [Hymenobacter sp.]
MPAFVRRHRVLLLHLSFWGAYCSFYFYQLNQEYGVRQALLLVGEPLLGNVLLAYFNYNYLLPRWLARPRPGRYLLAFGGALGLAVALKVGLARAYSPLAVPPAYVFSTGFVVATTLSTLFVVLFVAMLRFAVGWFELEAKTKALENAQLTSELQFLKAQINPHFLFNTLNNLYYLAYTQSPNTPEVVAKLAQMMRYLLEESNQPTVPLTQEIEFMRSYLHLEELRLNHPIPLTFTVEGEPAGVVIAPLILMTFLENAFKHGVRNNDPTAWVRVQLRVTPTGCDYLVANGRPTAPTLAPLPGTGLLNVRRRLALSYPGRHALRLDDTPAQYQAHLTIQLI